MSISLKTYSEFLETIPDAAMVVDSNGNFIVMNSQVEKLFGYQPGRLKGKTLDVLLPESLLSSHARMVKAYFVSPKERAMGSGRDISGRYADGTEFPLDIMLKPLYFDDVKATYALCVMHDISQAKKQEALLQKAMEREQALALTDYLTGISNARAFYNNLQEELHRLARFNRPFTIVYIDLDDFKVVNDTHGHNEGDRLLCAVAHYIKRQLRRTDYFARLGGDEFAILLTETGSASAKSVVEKLQKDLIKEMEENDWPVTFSIGVLTCIDTSDSVSELIKMADEQMYKVKKKGKNGISYSVYAGNQEADQRRSC